MPRGGRAERRRAADIGLNFRTGYVDVSEHADGALVMDRGKIFWNYLKGWFFVDFVSCAPRHPPPLPHLLGGEEDCTSVQAPGSGNMRRLELSAPLLESLAGKG
jgi:hypothetical protein